MRAAQSSPIFLILLLLCVTCPAFVLRKRSTSWDRAEGDRLNEALKVIQQERRRLEEEGARGSLGREEEDFMSNYVDEEPEDDHEAEEAEFIERLLEDTEDSFDQPESPLYSKEKEVSEIFPPQRKRSGELASQADLSELEKILEPSDDERMEAKKKRNVPYQLGGIPYDKPKRGETFEDREPVSAQEVQDMLDEEEEEYEEPENEPSKDLGSTLQPVTDAEIDSVLKDEEDGDEEEEEGMEEDEDVVDDGEPDEGQPDEGQEIPLEPAEEVDLAEQPNDVWPTFPAQEIAVNKEWLLDQYLQNADNVKPSVKRKRSDFPPQETQSRDVSNDVMDAATAREYIKTFLDLEDDENTNLANALNLATLGQVQKSDKYIMEEAKFIKRAIADEEAIQQLKRSLNIVRKTEESEVEEEEVPDVELPEVAREEDIVDPFHEVKRGRESSDEEEAEEENLIEDEELEEEAEKEEENEQIRKLLAEKFKQYLLRSEAVALEEEAEEAAEEEAIEEAKEVAEEQAKEDAALSRWLSTPNVDPNDEINDLYLNPFIRDLWEQYKASQERKRGPAKRGPAKRGPAKRQQFEVEDEPEEDLIDEDDLAPALAEEILEESAAESPQLAEEFEEEGPSDDDVQEIMDEYLNQLNPEEKELLKDEIDKEIAQLEEEICPVLEYVDNCAAAVQMGLSLDNEALDLCNRHQLCYTCGGAHGMSAESCDSGFLQEAVRLCQDEPDAARCRDDAAGLFTIISEEHSFIPPDATKFVCRSQCTLDYIYGLGAAK